MAATGNEVPVLRQIKNLFDYIKTNFIVKSMTAGDFDAGGQQDSSISQTASAIKISASTASMSVNREHSVSVDAFNGISIESSNETFKFNNQNVLTDSNISQYVSLPSVDIVKTATHETSYTKDTLEFVVDSTGKVTSIYFVSA